MPLRKANDHVSLKSFLSNKYWHHCGTRSPFIRLLSTCDLWCILLLLRSETQKQYGNYFASFIQTRWFCLLLNYRDFTDTHQLELVKSYQRMRIILSLRHKAWKMLGGQAVTAVRSIHAVNCPYLSSQRAPKAARCSWSFSLHSYLRLRLHY